MEVVQMGRGQMSMMWHTGLGSRMHRRSSRMHRCGQSWELTSLKRLRD
jgi:hypothetical protein